MRPHQIEHNKRVVDVHHERPHVSEMRTAEPVSAAEYERRHGTSLAEANAASVEYHKEPLETATSGGRHGEYTGMGTDTTGTSSYTGTGLGDTRGDYRGEPAGTGTGGYVEREKYTVYPESDIREGEAIRMAGFVSIRAGRESRRTGK